MKDIAPELLEKLQVDFKTRFKGNKQIQILSKKLEDGEATYEEANQYASLLGDLLVYVYKVNINAEDLPDGKMYYNIAKRIIEPTMTQNHDLISTYTSEVQTQINHRAGYKLTGIKPTLNQDKVQGIIDRVSREDDYNKIAWILDEPIKNFSQSIVDDAVKINAQHHYASGMKPKIIRTEVGNCCDWCKEVVGTYEYPKVPKNVFRRHRFCRCTVEYVAGDKRTNVHTKKIYKAGSEELLKRQRLQDIKLLNNQDDKKQYKELVGILGREKMPISLRAFKELKYNKPKEYEKIMDNAFIQKRFDSGEWKDAVNKEKQARHMKSTRKPDKSYFEDDVDVVALYNKYKMTGYLETYANGVKSGSEKVDLFEERKLGVDFYTGNSVNAMTIKYSKAGVHIIPTYYERSES